MRILEAASEFAPLAKSGGLGDVMAALPKALAKAGHDVKLFIPFYRSIKESGINYSPLDLNLNITVGGKRLPVTIEKLRGQRNGPSIYFVRQDLYFGRESLYMDAEGNEYPDNDERFTLFSLAIIKAVKEMNWAPDIVHAHDWQTALLPVYLKTKYADNPVFRNSKTIFTIHNLAYQGSFAPEKYTTLGLPEDYFRPARELEFYGKVNFMKAGISFADHVTTVSPCYAKEIKTKEFGCGLEGVLTEQGEKVTGILNGVDYTVWSPSRDQHISFTYHKANVSRKRMNKVELLNHAQLPFRDEAPLIGMISRLVDAKGFDLVAEAADEILSNNVQLVILGTGDKKYHEYFEALQEKHPDKVRAFLGFDEALAHRIEAGADIFLMPSKYEPCGLNQLYSLKFGTVPVVRKVGGLADSVIPYDRASGSGNGFMFEDYTADSMLSALNQAIELYSKKRVWSRLVKNCMSADHSWEKSANEYLYLFDKLSN